MTLILAGVYARQSVVTPLDGYRLHRRRKVSGATVNRELALLKHMFHLAIDWDLYSDPNPLRKVKYFQEINTGFRVLKPDEETRLLRSATPAIQDIILYALNTGSRIGEIFSLRWQDVDLDQGMIDSFSHKTQKIRIVPVNAEVRRILEFWKLGRKNEYVFYNQKTGERFVDPDAGLELACKKAEIEGVTPCYQLAAGSKVQLYYGYENCRFHSRRRLQGGRAPGSQNQKIPQSPF